MTLQTKKIIKAITVINTLCSSPQSLRVSTNGPWGVMIGCGCLPFPLCAPHHHHCHHLPPQGAQAPASLGDCKEGPPWDPRQTPCTPGKAEARPQGNCSERVPPPGGSPPGPVTPRLALSLCNSSVLGPPSPQAELPQALFSLAPHPPTTAQPNAPPLPS